MSGGCILIWRRPQNRTESVAERKWFGNGSFRQFNLPYTTLRDANALSTFRHRPSIRDHVAEALLKPCSSGEARTPPLRRCISAERSELREAKCLQRCVSPHHYEGFAITSAICSPRRKVQSVRVGFWETMEGMVEVRSRKMVLESKSGICRLALRLTAVAERRALPLASGKNETTTLRLHTSTYPSHTIPHCPTWAIWTIPTGSWSAPEERLERSCRNCAQIAHPVGGRQQRGCKTETISFQNHFAAVIDSVRFRGRDVGNLHHRFDHKNEG